MGEALYAPGLGYYAAGNVKLGSAPSWESPADDDSASPSAPLASGTASASGTTALPAGDFVTAPELGPLFARTLASQVAAVLEACGSMRVLEFGAGTGALAADLLDALDASGIAAQYEIMEV